MSSALSTLVRSVRRPEYTGVNRCIPCTILNSVMVFVATGVFVTVAPLDPISRASIGGSILVGAAALIYFRGYLIPGTPWITDAYFPDWILRYFEHHAPSALRDRAIEPVELFEQAAVVTDCQNVDDLCLTPEFQSIWNENISHRWGNGTNVEELATLLEMPVEALKLEDKGGAYVALAEGGLLEGVNYSGFRRVGQWESEGAFVADIAAAPILNERLPDWGDLTGTQRGEILTNLRIFLEQCPRCGGPVTAKDEIVKSCCRSIDVIALTCDGCGDRLFEAEAR